MKTTTILLCFLLLAACNQYKEDGIIDKQTIFVKEAPDSIPVFYFAYTKLPLTARNADAIIKEDSLFIFPQQASHKKIHIYHATTYDSLGAYITKGRGPNEVSVFNPGIDQVQKDSSGIKVVIQSFPQYVAIFNITKSLQANKPIFDKKYDFSDKKRSELMYNSSMFRIMSDGKLLSAENPYLSNKRVINPFLFLYDYDKNVITDSLPVTTFDENFIKAHPFIRSYYRQPKEGDHKVCAAFKLIDAIKIFDFKKKKNIVVKMSKDYPFSRFGIEYATNLMTTPDYIFRLHDEKINDKLITNIIILNWEGEILGRFNMEEYFYNIWINKEDKAIYALTASTGEIYKYNIEELYH